MEIEVNPKLAYHCRLSPHYFPELVEKNLVVVVEVLLKLMNSVQIADCFTIPANMDMRLCSMEVANRLTAAIDLPTPFIHTYISSCILPCEKYLQ
jgi:hypothetical protein